jgi:hypothetical protein
MPNNGHSAPIHADPAEILKSMSPGALRALMWLRQDGKERKADYTLKGTPMPVSMKAIMEAGLATMVERFGHPAGKFYAATSLGLKTRQEASNAEEQEPGHAP